MARYSGSQKPKKKRNRDLLASVHYINPALPPAKPFVVDRDGNTIPNPKHLLKLKVNDGDPSTYSDLKRLGPGPANPNLFRKVTGQTMTADEISKDSKYFKPGTFPGGYFAGPDEYKSKNKHKKNHLKIEKLMDDAIYRLLGHGKPKKDENLLQIAR